jgi:hypothetical protein
VLVVNPSVPAKNLQELIAYIKSKKGEMQYASSGNGTPQHLTAELFKTTAKLDMVHVPYKGSAPAITDLLGGHVPLMFDSTIAILPHIKAGKVKAIAVTGAEAFVATPRRADVRGSGMPGFESYAWYGFFAPSKTPKDVVAKLNAAAVKGHEAARVPTGASPKPDPNFVGDTPENFACVRPRGSCEVGERWRRRPARPWTRFRSRAGASILRCRSMEPKGPSRYSPKHALRISAADLVARGVGQASSRASGIPACRRSCADSRSRTARCRRRTP